MNINISSQEYRALLDMLCVADWVLNAFSGSANEYPEHQALRVKLFALYKEMDAEDLIEYDSELNDYFETKTYDENIQAQFIEPYDETLFWEELIHRLAIRDLIKDIGEKQFKNMDFVERAEKLALIERHYENDFEKNGLNNLVII